MAGEEANSGRWNFRAEIPVGGILRKSIFTEKQREAILKFIRDKKRSETVNKLVFQVNANWATLLADFKLLLKLKRLVDAGY